MALPCFPVNKMNRTRYYTCSVPQCTNTTIKTPEKLFIVLPRSKKCTTRSSEMRLKWLKLAGRKDAHQLSLNSSIYFCEDHFDLPNDMENYCRYKLMGSVHTIRMKPGCMPSKFDCQKKKRKGKICLPNSKDTPKSPTATTLNNSIQEENSFQEIAQEDTPIITNIKTECDSLSDESDLQNMNEEIKIEISQGETVHSNEEYIESDLQNMFEEQKIKQEIFEDELVQENEESSVSIDLLTVGELSTEKLTKLRLTKLVEKIYKLIKEEENSDSAPAEKIFIKAEESDNTSSRQETSQSLLEHLCETTSEKSVKLLVLQCSIFKIEKNPLFYVGIPQECYFLIDLLSKRCNLPVKHILVCLKKIRLDTTFTELGDDFGMSSSDASNIFLKNIPVISKLLKPLIEKADEHYFKVCGIINCFEIETNKQSKSEHRVLSDCKKIVKYLVSSNPDGLVNFVSSGYDATISNSCILEDSFLNKLRPGSCVLADNSFKNEDLFSKRRCHLLTQPSIASDSKLTKEKVLHTKEIASQRLYIERVIQRLKEFLFLSRPQSVYLIKVLDECIVIACALINLRQDITLCSSL